MCIRDRGSYEITEMKVPNGFLQLDKPVTFEIKNIKDYDTCLLYTSKAIDIYAKVKKQQEKTNKHKDRDSR